MALIIADRVKETTVTQGTGTITLSGATFGGFQSFSGAIGAGNTTYYCIQNESNFEIGIGTFSSGTLSRDTVIKSSNSDGKISITGVAVVFSVVPASKLMYQNEAGNFVLSGDVIIDDVVADLVSANSGDFGSILSNDFTNSGLLTLKRTVAGNFFHAYVDDANDKTIGLYSDAATSPTWKMGLKSSPSDQTSAPSYGYIYGSEGQIGLVGNSDNQITIANSAPFTVKHQGVNVITAHYSTGVHLKSSSSSYPALIVNGGAALSADIQRWDNNAGSTLSVIDNAGNLGVRNSNPSYQLDVTGTGNFSQAIRFGDATVQTTAALSFTAGSGLELHGAAFQVAASGANLLATNTPSDNQLPSYDLATGKFTWVSAGAGEANEYSFKTISVAGQDNVVADTTTDTLTFAAGSNVVITTTAGSDTVTIASTQLTTEEVQDIAGPLVATGGTKTLIAVTYDDANGNMDFVVDNDLANYSNSSSAFLTAHPSISAASSSDNSGRTYIQDITLDSNGHVTGLVTATETVTDTDTQLSAEEVQDIAGPLVATGGTKTGIAVTYDDANGNMDFVVDHDAASNFVANEHVDHTAVTLTAGNGLSGGGDISSNRSFTVAAGSGIVSDSDGIHAQVSGANLLATNSPVDNYVPSYDLATGKFTWVAAGGGGGSMTNFILEDGDGTEVTVSDGKEVKFTEGAGIDIDWTDVSDGSDGDPYDLTFTVDHDAASNFVSNEHIDHTSVTLTAGNGLSGGGDISSNRSFTVTAGSGIVSDSNGVHAQVSGANLLATNTPSDNQLVSYDLATGKFTWVSAGAGGENNEYSFKTISVAGQSDVVADTTTDTLTLAAGSNVTITTTAGTDTVTIAATDTVYTLPEATATTKGGIELFSDTDQSVAATAVSTTASRTYGLQLNSDGQGVVNVPWVDTNTTYSVGDGGLTTNDFTNADHTKLNGIEASADVTDATNVTAAGALMDSELAGIAAVKATTGTFLTADQTKLDAIEASADVTDATNVTAAGALMDSEVTNLAFVKALAKGISDGNVLTANDVVADNDFLRINGTEVEGLTVAEVLTALNVEAGATADQSNAEIVAAVEAGTDSNTFTDADHTKLNAIEASADVTDATNVTAAGALMDSECAGLAALKATTGTFLSADESKLDGIEASATADQTAGEILTLLEDGVDSVHYVDGSIDTIHIADNQVTLGKMAGITRGSILIGDASGDPAALAIGSNTYVLTSDGTDIAWAAAGGGAGDITAVVAGAGLTGGATSGSATVDVVGGDGITANANDVAITAAQTTVTSVYNASLKMGRDSQNLIDFATTDNKIILRVNNVDEVELVENALSPITTDGVSLGTSSLNWSDLFLDSGAVINFDSGDVTLTHSSNTLTVAGGNLAATLSTAAQTNITTVGTLTTLTVDSIIINGTTIGHTSDTDAITIAAEGDVTFSKAIKPAAPAAASGTSGIVVLDCNTTNHFTITTSGNITGWNFTNASPGQRIIVRVTNGASHTIAFSATGDGDVVHFPGGTEPVLTTSGGIDVYGFLCIAADTLDGFIIGQDIKA